MRPSKADCLNFTSDAEAFSVAFYDEGAESFVPLLLAGRGAGPGEDKVGVRDLTVGDEHLATGDFPFAPVKLSRGLDSGHVRACPGLRHGMGAELVAGYDWEEVAFLLLLSSPVVNG